MDDIYKELDEIRKEIEPKEESNISDYGGCKFVLKVTLEKAFGGEYWWPREEIK